MLDVSSTKDTSENKRRRNAEGNVQYLKQPFVEVLGRNGLRLPPLEYFGHEELDHRFRLAETPLLLGRTNKIPPPPVAACFGGNTRC